MSKINLAALTLPAAPQPSEQSSRPTARSIPQTAFSVLASSSVSTAARGRRRGRALDPQLYVGKIRLAVRPVWIALGDRVGQGEGMRRGRSETRGIATCGATGLIAR